MNYSIVEVPTDQDPTLITSVPGPLTESQAAGILVALLHRGSGLAFARDEAGLLFSYDSSKQLSEEPIVPYAPGQNWPPWRALPLDQQLLWPWPEPLAGEGTKV